MFFHCRALGGIGHFLSICRKILNWKWIWFSAKCCVLSAKSFSNALFCFLLIRIVLCVICMWWVCSSMGYNGVYRCGLCSFWGLSADICIFFEPVSRRVLLSFGTAALLFIVSLNLYQNVNRAGGILSSCNMAKWHQQHSHTYAHELGKYKNSSLHIWIRKWTEQMPLFCLWIWWMYKRPSHWGTLILNCLRIFTLWYGKQYNQKEV